MGKRANRVRSFRHRRCWAPVLALLLACAPAGAQVREQQPSVIVSGARVLLQDLVRAGTALPAGWGARSMAEAPPPQETRALSLTEVAQTMSGYDDMRHVVLRGKPVIQVSVKHRSVDLEKIQQAVDSYVGKHAAWKGRRFEVTTEDLKLPHVPEGTMGVAILGMREGELAGRAEAEIRVIVDGQPYGEGPVKVHLAELRPFWAANRPLSRGDTLTRSVVEKHWLPEREAGRYYPADNTVLGMELRRGVQTGQLLSAGMLDEPVYARRGEMVRVMFQRAGLTVTLRARALADGRRDDRILCVNEQSGRRMQVRLVQPRAGLLDDETGEPQT